MNLLNTLTIKNLKLNKKRTIVTIIGIVLSVALITAVSSIYASGIKSLINYEIYEQGNFHVAFYNVPSSEINTFKNNKAIEDIYITQNIGYAKIDSKNEYKPYAYIKAFNKNSLENLSVKLVDGKLPQNENEILIPTHLKTNGRLFLNIGDEITLSVGTRVNGDNYVLSQDNPYHLADDYGEDDYLVESIINKTNKKYKVVGIIERPATNIESYSAPGYTFITLLNNVEGNVDIYAKYTKEGIKNSYKVTANILGVDEELFEKMNKKGGYSVEEYDKYSEEMANTYNISVNSYLITLQNNPISDSGVGGLSIIVVIVCLIIIVTSVFCIKNSFDISITEKTKQYGMLKSIGATKNQIKKNVFYEAFVLGIIGIPLGIIVGLLATYILIIISNFYLNDLTNGLVLKFSVSFMAIIVSILLGIVTIYYSSFKSAHKASKVSPIDSIRNSANIKINFKNLKTPTFIEKIFGAGGVISYKNLKRNKKKYRTTVISIIVSVSVFISLSSFMNLSFSLVENELELSDYNISLSTFDINNGINDETYIKYVETTNLNNIENFTISRQLSIDFENVKYNPDFINWQKTYYKYTSEGQPSGVTIIAVGTSQYQKYIKSLGLKYNDIKDKGILIDQIAVYKPSKDGKQVSKAAKYMREFDYNIGDIIQGTNDYDEYQKIEIGYVTDTLPFGFKKGIGSFIVISDEMYDNIAPTKAIQIFYKSSNASKLQDDLDEYLKGENYNVNNIEERVQMMTNLFTLIAIFLYGFIIVISLIGITNIFNTITTSMELRKREFAMLKSVGMTTKEFSRMIRLESLFIGLKSLLYGLPIGMILSYLIYYFLKDNSPISYEIPIIAIIISIAVVFILVLSLMNYSMYKINKQNTIETIRNENI